MTKKKFRLFEVTGIELEYMVVDKDSLAVRPVVDKVFQKKTGEIVSDVPNGAIEWSNELVAHVLEFKTATPAKEIRGLENHFGENIREVNNFLKEENSMLLGTATHPFMDPFKETILWQHEYNEIYAMYNRIFDCRGHGWSNLQSMHINLPFSNDEEFEKLHAAIRVLLPIIPALSASSPIMDGKFTGFTDSRMEAYLHHQEKMPCLMGKLIPEQVFSEKDYNEKIFQPIIRELKPYDTENIMDRYFMNSRGAIARFDRGAIEIRVIDIQECPSADISIAYLIVETLKMLVAGEFSSLEQQKSLNENDLFPIFFDIIKQGESAVVSDPEFLRVFGHQEGPVTVLNLWKQIYARVKDSLPQNYREILETIFNEGSLSTRISNTLKKENDRDKIKSVYFRLAECLNEDKMFRG